MAIPPPRRPLNLSCLMKRYPSLFVKSSRSLFLLSSFVNQVSVRSDTSASDSLKTSPSDFNLFFNERALAKIAVKEFFLAGDRCHELLVESLSRTELLLPLILAAAES